MMHNIQLCLLYLPNVLLKKDRSGCLRSIHRMACPVAKCSESCRDDVQKWTLKKSLAIWVFYKSDAKSFACWFLWECHSIPFQGNFVVHKALVPAGRYIATFIKITLYCANNTTEYSKVKTLLINTSHSATVVSSWHRPTCHWSVDCVRILLCRRAGLSYRWSQLVDTHYSFTGLAAWNTPKLPFNPEGISAHLRAQKSIDYWFLWMLTTESSLVPDAVLSTEGAPSCIDQADNIGSATFSISDE